MAQPGLSVVIPVYQEVQSVPRLHGALARMADATPGTLEFVFVDDGSRDGTWDALVSLRKQDPRVRAIRLKRNFGQTAAMSCGIEAARGEVIVTMDGDLQNDPADIPKLLVKLGEGFDVVCGWRRRRQDKLLTRKVPSVVANRLIGWLTGVELHDYGCSLKAYRAEAIKRTPLYAEFHRFIPAMATLTGARIAEIAVNHRPRRYGRTKYNLWRTWKVAFDMVTVSLLLKFSATPMRLFGLLSWGAVMAATLCVAWWWTRHLSATGAVPQILPGVGFLCLWLAGHLFAVGLIAELCLVTAHAQPDQLVAGEVA
jgi:glycosyltransferase involved in cell wall biosynthesis